MTEPVITGDRELTTVINAGFAKVLTVRATKVGGSGGGPASFRTAFRSASLVALLPVLLELVLIAALPAAALHTLRAISWLAALSGLDLLAILLGWRTWTLLARAGPRIDDLLQTETDRVALATWFGRTLSVPRQAACSAAFAVIACVLLRLTEPAIQQQLEIGPTSYCAVALTGMIAGDSLYWLVVMSEFSRRLLRRPGLNVVWHSPASTPGLTMLSDAFTSLTVAVLAACLGAEVLALHAGRYGHSAVLATISNIMPVFASAGALLAGILPHAWLYLAVRDARRSALDRLRPLIDNEPPGTEEKVERLHERIELYRLVETSPGLPFNAASMVQYAAAVLGTLLAFVLERR
jgi:hypothetical protein